LNRYADRLSIAVVVVPRLRNPFDFALVQLWFNTTLALSSLIDSRITDICSHSMYIAHFVKALEQEAG
jgi:hypothetical protein